jgi:hypothetical protein
LTTPGGNLTLMPAPCLLSVPCERVALQSNDTALTYIDYDQDWNDASDCLDQYRQQQQFARLDA